MDAEKNIPIFLFGPKAVEHYLTEETSLICDYKLIKFPKNYVGMKAACLILTVIIVVAIMAVCVMVKFATDITVQERQRNLPYRGSYKLSKSMNVIALNENASQVAADKYPFVAAITRNFSNEWLFSCFGSVIQVKWIVTSAHCRKSGVTHCVLLYHDFIRNYSRTYSILFWRIHEKFRLNNPTPKYDIAVAKLNIELSSYTLRPSYFDDRRVSITQASIWKTVSAMDMTMYLTNDFEIFPMNISGSSMCSDTYGVHLDDSLICVDMTKYQDCFIHEFGPIFFADKVVGVLAMKPRDCDLKYAIFTNVSFYTSWIIRLTRSTYYG